MEDLFDRVDYSALPVLDDAGKIVGVVQRAAVREHHGERVEEDLAKVGGIIGGEGVADDAGVVAGRFVGWRFLLPILGLTLVSASVIAWYEQTIADAPNLAKFFAGGGGVVREQRGSGRWR